MAKPPPTAPAFVIKTPCGDGDLKVRWREIGEAYWQTSYSTRGDGVEVESKILSCRIDLPPQGGRIILVPFEDRGAKIDKLIRPYRLDNVGDET